MSADILQMRPRPMKGTVKRVRERLSCRHCDSEHWVLNVDGSVVCANLSCGAFIINLKVERVF